MKKILVVSNTAFSIEKFREHYLSKITNYQFIIYTPNKTPLLKKKYKNIKTKKFLSKNIFHDFNQIYKIIKESSENKIIVYSFKYQFIISILKIFFSFNIDIISIIAGRGSFNLGSKIKKYFYYFIVKIIINTSKVVICINPTDLIYFKQFSKNKNKFYLIPTEGVEKIRLKKKTFHNKNNYIFFGRLIEEKGIKDYIQAAKIIKKKYPEKKFFIAGPTSQLIIGQSTFKKKTKDLIFQNKQYVNYLGYINNFNKIFSQIDCLISPSFSEGAGTAVMEAMLSGLFVIAYKNSGHNYVLKGTQNLVTKKNNVKYLTKHIEKHIDLPNDYINKATEISQKKIIDYFLADNVASKFKEILEYNYAIKKKTIDIIWPFYKDKAYLDTAILNLNRQTLQPTSVIFIDDANEDPNLKEYIRKKLNKNIKLTYLINKSNYGVTKSISLAIKEIKSKYLYIQATDDIIYDNFFEVNIRHFEKNPKAAYVFSNIIINNEVNKKKYFIDFNFINSTYTTPSQVKKIYTKNQFKIYHNTVVLNSKKFINSNIFNPKFGRRADMLNLQYLSTKYGFCYLPENLSEFTIRKGQISSTLLSDNYLINELKFLKKEKKQFYNFFIKSNLHYEISIFSLFKMRKKFKNLFTFTYLSRSIKFKIWKYIRFHTHPKLLNFLFKNLN